MTSPFGPVADMAEELRDALSAAFTAAETAGGPPAPGRILVTEGVPAADFCDQLAVYVEALRLGLPVVPASAAIDEATATRVVVDIAAQVMRCAAPMTGNAGPPTVAALEEVARTVHSDAWVLTLAVLTGVTGGTLWGDCARATITEVRGIESQGGSVGFLLRASVAL